MDKWIVDDEAVVGISARDVGLLGPGSRIKIDKTSFAPKRTYTMLAAENGGREQERDWGRSNRRWLRCRHRRVHDQRVDWIV